MLIDSTGNVKLSMFSSKLLILDIYFSLMSPAACFKIFILSMSIQIWSKIVALNHPDDSQEKMVLGLEEGEEKQ